MIVEQWPLTGLVLRTPRLELRLPDLDRLAELAALAAAGVHDPAVQPFTAEATTQAFAGNHASYAVSRKLGYVDDGVERHLIRGRPVIGRRLWLRRAAWQASRRSDVRIEGLEPCLGFFG